jgi:tripeptide aminopeptidase
MIPESPLLDRFCRYVRIDTTSNRHSSSIPTTPSQAAFAKELAGELRSLGASSVDVDEKAFVIARFDPPKPAPDGPVIGFMAHMDTSEAAPGKGVLPIVHRGFDGRSIALEDGLVLDPAEFPDLARHAGDTVITSDGRTLLGADDKAGIAAIMAAMEYLVSNPESPRPRIEVIFTPDEETGLALPHFPFSRVSSSACYTIDGEEEGVVEAECFEAYRAQATFRGVSIHPGTARGKLTNAVEMAADFLSMIPRTESPQATDGRYGFYFPTEISGSVESAEIEIFIRDFADDECLRRIETLKTIAASIRAAHPGGSASVSVEKQYSNMKRRIDGRPEVLDLLMRAVERAGLAPILKPIRGGTDGARLSEMGIPTPNVFTGGRNYHSRLEWVSLSGMVKAAETLVHLAGLWTAARGSGREEQ